MIFNFKTKKFMLLEELLNNFYYGRCQFTTACYSKDIEIVIPRSVDVDVVVNVCGNPITNYDLVYFRNDRGRACPAIAQYLKKKSIDFLDKAVLNNRFEDKLSQTMIFHLNKLPTPKTVYLSRQLIKEKLEFLVKELMTPFVMKEVSAHQGAKNYLIKSKRELVHILSKVGTKDEFIFQEYIPHTFDYRLLVLGEKVRVAEKRIRTNSSTHLCNVARGAKEVFFPPRKVKKLNVLAIKAAKLLNRTIAGVDIIVSKEGHPYLLEVNEGPGFTYDTNFSPEIERFGEFLYDYSLR